MSDSKPVTPGDLRALTDNAHRAKAQEQFDRARKLNSGQFALRSRAGERLAHFIRPVVSTALSGPDFRLGSITSISRCLP
jgi:hypothetical protein